MYNLYVIMYNTNMYIARMHRIKDVVKEVKYSLECDSLKVVVDSRCFEISYRNYVKFANFFMFLFLNKKNMFQNNHYHYIGFPSKIWVTF